jgi:hypothetical protein
VSAPAAPVVRYCFVRLLDGPAADREARAHALAAELAVACAPCPVWVGVPADESAVRWDLAVTIGLPDLTTWQALAASPAYEAVMARLTVDAKVVKAWTFARPAAAPQAP